MNQIEQSRAIVNEWHSTPPPKAGINNPDDILVNIIARHIEAMTATEVKTVERVVSTSDELAEAVRRADHLTTKKIALDGRLGALADRLEGDTFGAGIATVADLYAVAKEIREIVRTT